MTNDQLDDLKQFIDSRVSQSEQSIRTDMNIGFAQINQKVDDGFEGIGEAIEIVHKNAETQESEVNLRFTKLEQQTA